MARQDQALSFHRVAGKCYELSGLRTGSVRDQILRAQVLVERLLAAPDTSPDPLLIVGGGAAGVCAALTASTLGRDVTLLEFHNNPFRSQARVTTRWLDPTEFDWPHVHWDEGDIEWNKTSYGLPYRRNWADQLASQWQLLWYAVVGPHPIPRPSGSGEITEYTGVDARLFGYTRTGDGVYVTPLNSQFCAVISCVGFSGEHTTVTSTAGGELVGPEFWSTDALASIGPQPSYSNTRPTRVLISGGGDGAQQDFLRVLTGTFGRELFDRLALQALGLNLTDVLLAEDSGRRAHAWGDPASPPTQAYAHWHAAYERLVDTIWDKWAKLPAQHSAARRCVSWNVEVTWLFREAVPGYCYGLNRLLALVVARLHAEKGGRPLPAAHQVNYTPSGREVYLPGFELHSVTPAGAAHTCGPACYGLEHEVRVQGFLSDVAPGIHTLGQFDVIVIRHGPKSKPLFGAPPVSEQLIPFDLPA